MNNILLPNLFFEEELQSIATTGSSQARRLVAELEPVMGLLGAEESGRVVVVVDADAKPDDIPAALRHVEFLTLNEAAASVLQLNESPWNVIPWGWSESAVGILERLFDAAFVGGWPLWLVTDTKTLRLEGARPKSRGFLRSALSSPGHPFGAPGIDVVRTINSRCFQSKFDVAVAIDGSERIEAFGTLCHDLSHVESAIRLAADFSSRGWVIKADLSHASRNRLLGNGIELRQDQRTWLESRFAKGECVYVEPWVERITECGLQFQIAPSIVASGATAAFKVEFIGAAEMLTDDAGRYRGSVVYRDQTPDAAHNRQWQPAIDHCRHVATTAATEGYFGPMGFDCMIFRHPQHNSHWLRLSHDINGRMTMGRVALSLKRLQEPGETGIWLHTSENSLQQIWNGSDDIPLDNVRIERTSPGLIGGKPAKTVTAFVVSGNSEQLRAACARILGQTVKMPTRL